MIKYFKWLKMLLHKDIQKPLKLLKMKELNQYRKEKMSFNSQKPLTESNLDHILM
ncbi:two partner secretion A domain protein [Neisseria meningitidis NM2866]|nr:two partner secretion A domain protein [Neisseria meningitidis 9757]ELL07790.1 two partner secretion A domain protein [Neisseria meningitidis 65014]EOB39985.1 two partner secretion A domain protein [Neisseria meningitidis 69155]EOB40076.1 two partner secretion A domain protein [Neisseria meningitidis 69176]EOB46529.1 two partner secretion A domain protein [Neisseria meningitidis 2000080]EOB46709.1 two partner secretion A domain protein [Neisseria meningitidis 94018]EOB52401.1 two partner s